MKIILITTISNLGKVGDVVEVKNGYAKNFLIPNKKAICFTPSNVKVFETKKGEFLKAHEENLDVAGKIKEKVAGKNIIILENASDDGRLYGSVNASVIAGRINDIIKQKTVSRSDIFLKKPVKEIGIYDVKVSLHSEINFEVKVIVSRSESEAEALLKASEKKNSKSEESSENQAAEGEAVENEKPKKLPRKKKEESAE